MEFGFAEQIGFRALTVLTFLPTVGALIMLLFMRGRPNAFKATALVTSLATFGLSHLHGHAVRNRHRGLPVPGELRLDQSAGHQLPSGCRRHLHAAPPAHLVPLRDRHPGILELREGPGTCLLHQPAGPRDRHDRRVRGHGHVPVLRVLGDPAHPHVLPDRHLGRSPSYLRRHQVLPVHLRRVGADAGCHHRGGLVEQQEHGGHHLRHPDPAEGGPAHRCPGLGVRGVLHSLRHQGAHVPGAHLASRRPRRGPHGRLGHPGRRPAEDGRLRHDPLLHRLLPRDGGQCRAGHHDPLGDSHHLRSLHLPGPDGHEEAGCLLLGQPHGLHHPRALRAERRRASRVRSSR